MHPWSGLFGPDQLRPTPQPAAPSSSSGGELGEDRRRRRMLSNRESARRSRMRKQTHLAELRSLVGRLRLHNRQMLDELNRVMSDHDRVELDNRRLREAELELRRRLEGSSTRFLDTVRRQSLEKSLNNGSYLNESTGDSIPREIRRALALMAAAFILASAFSAFAGVGGLVLAIQVCVVRRAMRRGFLGFGAAFCQLRPELLAELPCFELKQESGDECAVCLEKLETGDCCRRLPACAHVFHARCVDSWLRRSSRCPTCRTSAVAGEKW
ncbi:hypothetical protein ZIOFF_041930 [Zingiber officinale]|uniref:RING-type domain-containing protein n=2 Tax=Zingiber officinale TaxID=94328 RepID=A0A8J5KWJ9_ZINOF|nr:hypothetical protein ZIOFF_041930 [Zingiber officinale]